MLHPPSEPTVADLRLQTAIERFCHVRSECDLSFGDRLLAVEVGPAAAIASWPKAEALRWERPPAPAQRAVDGAA